MCQKLGWLGAGTDFDVLPLVLQAANCDHPEVFEIPKELILEVQLHHPTQPFSHFPISYAIFYYMKICLNNRYEWFAQLGLKWFGVPVITGLAVDCGGLIYPSLPFNGWYTSFEIGTRNLTDSNRYNKLEVYSRSIMSIMALKLKFILLQLVAKKMGLDTSSPTTLWKDRAVLELNAAVLHSFKVTNTNVKVVQLAIIFFKETRCDHRDHHTVTESFMT